MTNVALVTDIHVNIKTVPYQASWEYFRLIELAKVLMDTDASEVWVLGDLFDKHHPSILDIAAVKDFFTTIGKPIKFIEGNHERMNKDIYTMHVLKDVLNIEPLPELQEIDGVSITAIGHDRLPIICDVPNSDILVGHFRWSHSMFGRGELSTKEEKKLVTKFKQVILGDIHDGYEPTTNVAYIGSPYSVSFSTSSTFGIAILSLDKGNFTFTKVPTTLPNKIVIRTTLNLVHGVLEGCDTINKYRVIVKLAPTDMPKFKQITVNDNIELLGEFKEGTNTTLTTTIEVGNNVKDILINILPFNTDEKTYINNLLKE